MVDLAIEDEFTGPLAVIGGDGDDGISVFGESKPGISVSGDAGDDEIAVQTFRGGAGVDVACGPGNDRTSLRLSDRPGDGCAAHPAVSATRRVSRAFEAQPERGRDGLGHVPSPARQRAPARPKRQSRAAASLPREPARCGCA